LTKFVIDLDGIFSGVLLPRIESAWTKKVAQMAARLTIELEAQVRVDCEIVGGIRFWSGGFLCLDQSGYEVVEVGGVDVADSDDLQVWCGCGVEGKAGAVAWE
jgi:hypothetical protein